MPRPSLRTVAEDRGDDPVRVRGTGGSTPPPHGTFFWTPYSPIASALVGDGSGVTLTTAGSSKQAIAQRTGSSRVELYHAGSTGRLWVTVKNAAGLGKGKPVDPGGPPATFDFVDDPVFVTADVAGAIPFSYVVI